MQFFNIFIVLCSAILVLLNNPLNGSHSNSPSGKLVQIEHALTAVGSGQTSLGIKGNSVPITSFYMCNGMETSP